MAKKTETRIREARGNGKALATIRQELELMLNLTKAFQNEVVISDWAKANLRKEVRP